MKTVAIVGASRDRDKYGNKAVRAYHRAGFRVFPIHPTAERIEGLRAYRSVQDVPDDLDRISVYLPPAVTRTLLPELSAKGASEVWLNPGSADSVVLEEARQAGITVRQGCSIVDIGMSPSEFQGG